FLTYLMGAAGRGGSGSNGPVSAFVNPEGRHRFFCAESGIYAAPMSRIDKHYCEQKSHALAFIPFPRSGPPLAVPLYFPYPDCARMLVIGGASVGCSAGP